MTERIYICTPRHWKAALMKELLGTYLVDVEGPTNDDPGYLLKADIPAFDMKRIRSGLIEIGKML